MVKSQRIPFMVAMTMLAVTVAQLAFATFSGSDLPQFEGKAFGARLVFYPVMMLAVPAVWAIVARIKGIDSPIPWAGVAFIMEPFLVDVTGNTLNLYDKIDWWDDLNHFVNWGFMTFGIGILLRRAKGVPPWAVGTMVVGWGAILAILWEVGEWYTFIRHGKELNTAYEDTLFDEVLGTSGATVAALLTVWLIRRAAARVAPRQRAAEAV
jgi:hypothetical protein